MLNWRKLALSSAVVLGMMTVAGTAYGSDDVFLNENSHTASTTLDSVTKVTWNSPLYTENMDALNAKLGDAAVRLEIIREAGFKINNQPAYDWHPGSISVNGQEYDGYLTFKSSRLLSVGSTARIVVKFNDVYNIQFQVLYQVSANESQSESWYGAQGMYVGIQQGGRPVVPEDPEAPKPEEPGDSESGWTTGPIDAPDFSQWTTLPGVALQKPSTGDISIDGNTDGGHQDRGDLDIAGNTEGGTPNTQPADALQKPDTQPADALQKPGYGVVPAPSTPDHGQQTIDGNTEGGRPDTGYIAAPSISGEGDSNVTGPDAPTADNQNNSNDSNGVATSPVATPDGAQTDSVTNGTLGLVSAGVNPIARAAVFGNDAAMLYGNNATASQQTLNPGSSNGNRTRLGGSNTGRDLIHDMIVSDDAKRSNALKMEQAGVGSEWITMVAGAILGFLFAFFRRRKEEERDEENEA